MKQLKKAAVATVLASAMITGAVPALAADETKDAAKTGATRAEEQKPQVPAGMIQEPQAIAKARQIFAGLQQFKYASAYYSNGGGRWNTPIWMIDLSAVDRKTIDYTKRQPPSDSLHVELDAKTGEMISFSRQNPDWTGDANPTKEAALATAQDALLQYAPDLAHKVKKNALHGGGATMMPSMKEGEKGYSWTYSDVVFYEDVHGVPFESNTVSFKIDQYGHVVGMDRSFRFDSSKLPDSSKALSQEKAVSIISDMMKMQKYYQTRVVARDANGQYKWIDRPILSYSVTRADTIDAITGQPADQWWIDQDLKDPQRIQLDGGNQIVIAKDKEDAKRIVAKMLNVDLSKLQFREMKQQGLMMNRDVWSFEWMNMNRPGEQKDFKPMFINAQFDAATGQLLNLHKSTDDQQGREAKPAFTLEQGRAKVIELVKGMLPAGSQELFLMHEFDNTQGPKLPSWLKQTKENASMFSKTMVYGYTFNLGHQSVPVSDQSFYVQIDATTGDVVSLSQPVLTAAALPDNKNTVSEDVAKAEFLRAHPVKLMFNWPQYFDQAAPQGQLVYHIDTSDDQQRFSYIDAFTGKMVVVEDK